MRVGQLIVVVVAEDRVGRRARVERTGLLRLWRWFQVDLELVVVAHVKRVQTPVGVLQLLGTVDREGLDVDVEDLESIGGQADVFCLQVFLKIAHCLTHVDLVVHVLAVVFDAHVYFFAYLHVHVR